MTDAIEKALDRYENAVLYGLQQRWMLVELIRTVAMNVQETEPPMTLEEKAQEIAKLGNIPSSEIRYRRALDLVRAIRDEENERCARVADNHYSSDELTIAADIAKRIRALRGTE